MKDPAAARGYARVVLANTAVSWFRRRSWRNEHPTEQLPESAVEHDPSTRTAVVDARDPTTGECMDTGATATGQLMLVTGIAGAAQ